MKIKDFIEELKKYDSDLVLNFSGLDFYRLKDRGDFVQVEFNQNVYKDKHGKVIIENN
ncbi:MAG: hypothetical protein ACOCP4_04320 [Candidatus Woesearchaeota archaeon]